MVDVIEGHTVHKYDEELGNARRLVLEMGGRVLEQVRKAILALDQGDIDLAREVIDHERETDADELRLDEAILDLIATRQPVGRDLRFILALSKITGDLERAGDKAAQIAWCVIRLMDRTNQRPASKILHHIHSLDQVARRQLERSLDAFAKIDMDLTLEVFENAPRSDEGFDTAIHHAMTFVFEGTLLVGQVLEIVFILRALANIGNHAGNIARQIIFVVEGEDVRYQNKEILIDTLRKRKGGR